MSHAFQKLYTLINTLLNWSEDNSFLEDVLFQIMDVIEDIENVFNEKEKQLEESVNKTHGFMFTCYSYYHYPNKFENFIADLKGCNSKEEIKKVLNGANAFDGNEANGDIAHILSHFIEFESTSLSDLNEVEQLRKEMEMDK
jgi:hypothetical protein